MNVDLNAQLRNKSGKGAARSLRREDMVPAVLYGPKTEAVSLSVSARELEKLLRELAGESKLLNLNVDREGSQDTRQVLIREVQVHPVRRRFLHVDFYEAPLDKMIVVEVPIETVGDSIGVRKGGTLNTILRVLSVRCLPADIPHRVQVDITNLDLGDTLHVRELQQQVSVQLADDPNFAILAVEAPEGAKEEAAS